MISIIERKKNTFDLYVVYINYTLSLHLSALLRSLFIVSVTIGNVSVGLVRKKRLRN